jgi:hypothetical protein
VIPGPNNQPLRNTERTRQGGDDIALRVGLRSGIDIGAHDKLHGLVNGRTQVRPLPLFMTAARQALPA